MGEKINAINSEMLIWARNISGIPIEKINEIIGEEKIENWESGNDFPTYPQLKKLSTLYRKPIAIFFFPEPPKIKSVLSSCRTLPKDAYNKLSSNLTKMLDKARVTQLNLYELYEDVKKDYIIFSDIKFDINNIERLIIDLRELMETDLSEQIKISKIEDSFEYWRNAFYKIGIFVFKDAFEDDSVSGFCLYDSEFPVIYINNSFSFTRQVFTLFHELFHLINQTSGIDFLNDEEINYANVSSEKIEKECNKFSGEFLVPDSDFDKNIIGNKIDDNFISKLSKRYGVSREVILRKFLDRKLIDANYYFEKRKEYNSDYFRIKNKLNENKTTGIIKEEAILGRLKAELKYFGKDFAPQRHLFEEYGIINNKIGE